jgi:hypothetical protein
MGLVTVVVTELDKEAWEVSRGGGSVQAHKGKGKGASYDNRYIR